MCQLIGNVYIQIFVSVQFDWIGNDQEQDFGVSQLAIPFLLVSVHIKLVKS